MSNKNSFKIVLLGEGRVGKTSLVLRYVNNTFSDKQVSTIQASFVNKRLTIADQTVQLSIWDTAGQERFHALGPIYYRDADGALLTYDITDADSFAKVKQWVKELRKMVGSDIVVAIAGNKCDLERNRQVPLEEAEQYAESVGAVHFSTSAKLNKNIDEVFLSISKRALEKKAKSGSRSAVPSGTYGGGGGGGGGGQRPGLQVVQDGNAGAKPDSKGCC